ncbi:MAG: Hpt domain-containing protein, partial [Desulfuromonadales bacterium]|nr:Hpt domain-containing protein [Desulfuromonadales bacterium]
MDPRDVELLARLLPTFRLEAEEHLRQIERLLTSLGRQPSNQVMQEAFREVHSLKGAARAVGASELEELCQEMEAVFAALGKGELALERD